MEQIKIPHYEPTEQHKEHAVFFVPIDKIRVAEKQARKISKDKVERHKQQLLKHENDLLPIDARELEDGLLSLMTMADIGFSHTKNWDMFRRRSTLKAGKDFGRQKLKKDGIPRNKEIGKASHVAEGFISIQITL
jgi:hypothetical protein